jgi:hypothetical protein
VRVLQEALNAGRLGADVTLTVKGWFGPRTDGFLLFPSGSGSLTSSPD